MLGALAIVVVLAVVLPVLTWVGLGAVAFVASAVMTDHAEATHAGSDLIATNV